MLVADGLAYSFVAGQPLFDDVSIRVPEGSCCAVFGPSGVGKSTLLALVGGLLRSEVGSVTLDGAPLTAERAVAEAAWITQQLHLFPARTVIDNVVAQALVDGADAAATRSKALPILDKLGIADRADERARVLSGGERQRMILARALVSGRRLLLADEPTSQLDRALARSAIETFIESVHESRIALVVTHDPDLVASCDIQVELGNS